MLSVESISAMPAVNSVGNTRMDHTGNPFVASVAEMPSNPTSVAVSKPSPNRKPTGYICQLCPISRNKLRKMRPKKPRCDRIKSKSSSTNRPPPFTRWKVRQMDASTTRFAPAITSRKHADTAVPTIPPIASNAPNRLFSVAEVSAIATDSAKTIVECPSEK